MIMYLLEITVFQLLFLAVYDFFLKKETFFQWNRVYLLGTFVLSMILPWIKIEALKTTVATKSIGYTNFLWQSSDIDLTEITTKGISFWEALNPYQLIFIVGALVMTFLFLYKLYKIQNLRSNGEVSYHKGFTKITVRQSEAAFSFLKQVFLGDNIPLEKEPQLLAHELVHIRQWHSLDLLFFELMRTVMWFNPLVYLYQHRITELHEFIVDSELVKNHKSEQYQLLLSEVFNTQNLSFVNPFFKESLVKNRIVMLAREKSKKVNQLKYFLLLPLMMSMLLYSSCEPEIQKETELGSTKLNAKVVNQKVPFAPVQEPPTFPGCESFEDSRNCFLEKMQRHIRKHFNYPKEAQDLGIEGRVSVMFTIDRTGAITNIQMRGPHPLLENEVERIIKNLPKMKPGKHNGKVVEVPFSIPVNFVLSGGKNIIS